MTNFEKWNREFGAQNLYAFNNDKDGLLWLKVRAVCRNKQLQQFCEDNGIALSSKGISGKNVELFEKLEKLPDAMSMLDSRKLRRIRGIMCRQVGITIGHRILWSLSLRNTKKSFPLSGR